MSIHKSKKNSFLGAVSQVSGATAFSRVLGLVREQVMAYYFGAGMATDAFLAAFRIPNLLRDMFAEGALSAAFVPVFKEYLVKKNEDEAFKLAHIVITTLLLFVGLVVVLGIIAAPGIVYISAKGFADVPGKFGLTVALTRWMMIYLLLVSLSALVMGMLNSFGRFGIPAIAPAMFNAGIIFTVWLGFDLVEPARQVYLLAGGVLIGGTGQLLIQLPPLLKIGYRFKPVISLLDDGLKKVIRLLTPMIIGLSAGRINILLNTLIASFLIEGSISFLSYAYRLMHFPLGVFAVALGTVALPKVTELVAKKEHDKLTDSFLETVGSNMFLVVPSAVFLALMGRELIDLIFSWGAFDANAAGQTALALLHYSYGLLGFAMVRVIVPYFYAFGDSRLPMRASLIAVTVNIILYYPLVKMLNFAGLAAATSLSGILNCLLLLYLLPSKGVRYSKTIMGLLFFKTLIAAVIAIYVSKVIPLHFYGGEVELIIRIERVVIPLLLGGVLYLLLGLILRLPLPVKIWRRLRRS